MGSLTTKDGKPTGGVYGFATMALEVINRLSPDYVAIAWDKPKTNIRKRRELYPDYKIHRKPAPPDFYEQIPMLHELLDSFGWPLYELDDYEADDIMGALAVQAKKANIETLLITSDLDMLQLINTHVHVYALKKGLSNIELFHPESFEAKYGIRVDQYLDLKSLKGDSSDNIPGVPGVGEKTALKLIEEYETLDNVYKNLPNINETTRKKLAAGKELAYLSKQLAHIWIDAPIKLNLDEVDGRHIKPDKVIELLTKLEFRTLANKAKDVLDISESDMPGMTFAEHSGEVVRINTSNKAKAVLVSQIANVDNIFVQTRVQDNLGKSLKALIVNIDAKQTYIIDPKLLEDTSFIASLFSKKSQVIGYDLKPLIKVMINRGIDLPPSLFDLKIAAFLYNSLERDLSVSGMAKSYLNWQGPELDNLDISELEALAGEIMQVIRGLYSYFQIDFGKSPEIKKIAKEIEMPMIPILAAMEIHGIALDTDYLRKLGDQLTDKLSDIEQEIYGYADEEFNINSPKQLADILFEKLALPTAGVKKGKTGYSTAAGELTKLKFAHPIIELIQNHREMSKLMNTYVNTLPDQVDEDGRVHTNFSLTTAQTGRLSSNDPNLQNIPTKTELGNQVRRAFRAPGGRSFVSADYSQFELRIAAFLAGDKDMIEVFNDDIDIHMATAMQIYGRNEDDITKTMRRDAKVINFGVLYGMSPHGLSEATGMTIVMAKDYIDKYFVVRKPLQGYLESLKEQARTKGYVATYFGRRRYTPDVLSSNFIVRSAAERAAINMPIQGTASDIMKIAMLKVQKKLEKFTDTHMLLQIHDSLIVEVPTKDAEQIAKLIKETMENAVKLDVKITVDTAIADNWADL